MSDDCIVCRTDYRDAPDPLPDCCVPADTTVLVRNKPLLSYSGLVDCKVW